MKSEWIHDDDYERYYCECSCHDISHLLIFEKFKLVEEGEFEIAVYISNNPHMTLIRRRLAQAFKLIFKKQYNYVSDDVLIDKNNVIQLEEFIESIKGIKENKEEFNWGKEIL